MDAKKHKRIEQRAYAVWQAEGRPQGKHEEHWHSAARQIEAEEGAQRPDRRKEKRGSGNGAAGSRRKKSKK